MKGGQIMNKKKVYISGKVTGLPMAQAKRMFSEAEEHINRTGKYEAVKPLKFDEVPDKPWEYYMRKDIRLLMCCDMICPLPNWADSKGAKLEMHIAQQLGMEVLIIR